MEVCSLGSVSSRNFFYEDVNWINIPCNHLVYGKEFDVYIGDICLFGYFVIIYQLTKSCSKIYLYPNSFVIHRFNCYM